MRYDADRHKPTAAHMPEALITIIIPCFNAAAFVGAAVESALNQTWPNIEVIIVDDGSTDGSADVIEKQFGHRVRFIRQENRGAAAARNRALSEARGDFIQYLDADDLLAPEKVAVQMHKASLSSPGAITWCQWQPFRTQPGDMPFRVESAQFDMTPADYLRLYMEERTNIPHVCHLIPRAVTERAGPWDESLSVNDDGEYAARIVSASSGLVHAGDGPLYFYRKKNGSLSAINSERKLYSAMVALDKIAALAEAQGGDVGATKIAWKYYALMTSSYPHSRPYLKELQERIAHYGGGDFKPKLGGPALNRLAEIVGWKAARRGQLAFQKIRPARH